MSDRAKKGGGIETPIPTFLGRVGQAVKYAIAGVTPSTWFSPSQPLPPQAQEVAGRQWDFPIGVNLQVQPRSTEGISFSQLRALADNCDVLRLVIENHKDKLCRMPWKFQLRDQAQAKKGAARDPRLKTLEDFFRKPDRENSWSTWYRIILEDLLVIDAPAIYVRKTRGGVLGPPAPYSLDIIDGATIARKIDQSGRTPIAPSPAYQQVLHGLPAVDYSTAELIYAPRNLRSNRLYGFSPVEQIIMTVNIALRRQLHQLQFYTEGNVPDLLIQVPENWQPDQIKQFQLFFNTLTDTGDRRKTRFLPNGCEPYDTKQKQLKDEFDEWLARIVCFCFSVSPQPFIKENNRATAETAADTAKEEGLEPYLDWTKSFMDRVIADVFGWGDLEAVWNIPRELDPETQAKIDDMNVKNGTETINEVRARRGQEPDPNGDKLMIYTGTGPITLEDALAPVEDPEPPPATGIPVTGKGSPQDQAERVERRKKKASNRSTGGGPLY